LGTLPLLVGGLLLVLVTAGEMPASAAVVVDEDVQTMAARADVVARVVVKESFQAPRGGGRLAVWTRVVVQEGLKGVTPGASLWVVQPGGAAGGAVTVVPGTLRLGPGQEVVLFADRLPGAPPDVVVLYALGRGIFRVERGPGEPRVTELVAPGTRVSVRPSAGPTPGSSRALPRAQPRWSSSLSAFEDAVRLGAAGPARPR